MCVCVCEGCVASGERTHPSTSLRHVSILGKISASTTTSARSTECLAICPKHEHTCTHRHLAS